MVPMELDTGNSVSIVSEEVYKSVLGQYQLCATDIKLKSYSRNKIELSGQCEIPVKYDNVKYNLLLLLAEGKRASFLAEIA